MPVRLTPLFFIALLPNQSVAALRFAWQAGVSVQGRGMLPCRLIGATHHFLLCGGESDEERERGGGKETARPVSGYGSNRTADVMLRRAQAFHLLRLGVCEWGGSGTH